jgi:hypothetical protein
MQVAAGIDGHLAQPWVDQPDVWYAFGLVLFQLLHHFSHLVVFREDFDDQEGGVQQVFGLGSSQQNAHIRQAVSGGSRLRAELRQGKDLRIFAAQSNNEVALDQRMQPIAYVALLKNTIHVFHVWVVRRVQVLFQRHQRPDAHAPRISEGSV